MCGASGMMLYAYLSARQLIGWGECPPTVAVTPQSGVMDIHAPPGQPPWGACVVSGAVVCGGCVIGTVCGDGGIVVMVLCQEMRMDRVTRSVGCDKAYCVSFVLYAYLLARQLIGWGTLPRPSLSLLSRGLWIHLPLWGSRCVGARVVSGAVVCGGSVTGTVCGDGGIVVMVLCQEMRIDRVTRSVGCDKAYCVSFVLYAYLSARLLIGCGASVPRPSLSFFSRGLWIYLPLRGSRCGVRGQWLGM